MHLMSLLCDVGGGGKAGAYTAQHFPTTVPAPGTTTHPVLITMFPAISLASMPALTHAHTGTHNEKYRHTWGTPVACREIGG